MAKKVYKSDILYPISDIPVQLPITEISKKKSTQEDASKHIPGWKSGDFMKKMEEAIE